MATISNRAAKTVQAVGALLLFGGTGCLYFVKQHMPDAEPHQVFLLLAVPAAGGPLLNIRLYYQWESLSDAEKLRALGAFAAPFLLVTGALYHLVPAG